MTVKEAIKEIETAQSLARFLDKTAEGVLDEREGASFERASLMLQTYAAMIMEMEVMDP